MPKSEHELASGIVVKIDAEPDERKKLETALLISVEYLDRFFEGRFAALFKGLRIEVGDNITESAGEAFGAENKIVLDRQKMLMTVREADAFLARSGLTKQGDRLRAVPENLHDMPVAAYEFVHEVGHIMHDQSEIHLAAGKRRPTPSDLASKSPTHLYMQDPARANEAIAEGFAYLVFSKKIDPDLEIAIRQSMKQLMQR
jgi:hypothetical protein